MIILCSLGLHRWSRWTEPEGVNPIWSSPMFKLKAEEIEGFRQTRTCKLCGKFEERLVHG